MIEVSELAEATAPKSGREVNELLLGHIGKAVRIRSISLRDAQLVSKHDGRTEVFEAAFYLEMAGTLLLVDFSEHRIDGISLEGGSELMISLAGAEGPRALDFEGSVLQIQAVTSDTSGWRIIYQSPQWASIEAKGEAEAFEEDAQ